MKKQFRALNDDLLTEWRELGYIVAGIDEVGRGCLAGPVVAAAVILPPGIKIPGARDSKLLSLAQREKLSAQIKQVALAVGIGWAHSFEVDQYGLTWAVAESGRRALKNLNAECNAVLLDGNHNYLKDHCLSRAVIKADNLCLSVACASIVAKVARDRYMKKLHDLYPQYGWNTNAGYATKKHLAAISFGLTPHHRRLFAPVKNLETGYVG